MSAQMLEGHRITTALRSLGLTEAQLESIHFWKHGSEIPFHLWPITFPWAVDKKHLSLFRDYATLKWLLINAPPASPQRDEAFRCVGETALILEMQAAQPIYETGVRYLEAQRKRAHAKRPVTENRRDMKALVAELCRKPENREASAAQLWLKFYAHLADADLDPEERGKTYRYTASRGREKTIMFSTFANLVSNCRRRLSH